MSITARHYSHAKKARLSAAQTAAIALLGSSLALSQAFGQAQPPANGGPAASSAAISDQKIKAAAAAIPQVEGIRQNYEKQLAQVPSGDKSRLENQAGDEMKKAIADQGLSIAEYNSILETAEKDPDIRERLIQQMPQPDHAPGLSWANTRPPSGRLLSPAPASIKPLDGAE